MNDDELIIAVKRLVADGEYLDEIPGLPGVRLGGGGTFRGDRRLYRRGDAEFLAARGQGLTDRLPPLRPVASPDAVDDAERLIGDRLPPLLRRLYLEVGNGGFGPGYGILGVRVGYGNEYHRTAVELYKAWAPNRLADNKRLLPVCSWGCGIYSLIDCATTEGAMWGWDPNPVPPNDLQKALFIESLTLHGWLERWLDGTLNQPTVVEDPSTGAWRGATDEEHARWAAEAGL